MKMKLNLKVGYVIKHKKLNIYYHSTIVGNSKYSIKDSKHFVKNINEAKRFILKRDVNKVLNTFEHPENFEIMEG